MTPNKSVTHKRPYLYEIDLIRSITVFSVVTIHTFAYTSSLIEGELPKQMFSLVNHLLHYNREMFMFITAFVLTYVYYDRQFSVKRFWFKRLLYVLVPYVLWSFIYVKYNYPTLTGADYLKTSFFSLLTGGASFQLYYVLLALQFYFIFPYFLFFIKKIARKPWLSLGISLSVQLLFLQIDYMYIQSGIVKSKAWDLLFEFQNRIVLIYQFFFFFGGFTAIYEEKVRQILTMYGRFIPYVFLAIFTVYTVLSFWQIQTYSSVSYATSVLQPSVVLYSIAVICLFFWLSFLWAKKRHGYRLVKTISDTSFGVYLVHVMIISLTMRYLLPLLPSGIPIPIQIVAIVLFAFSASVAFCALLLRIPWLSWTIGRQK